MHKSEPYLRTAEITPSQLVEVGWGCSELIAFPSDWVNRLVETIEMLSQEETRRWISVDFTLPADAESALDIGYGIVVPLGILTKDRRRHFDLRDETGAAVPVLGREDNVIASHAALVAFASSILADSELPGYRLDEMAEILWSVVAEEPDIAINAVGKLLHGPRTEREWIGPLLENRRFVTMLDLLSTGYLLLAVVPKGSSRRRILKVSYGFDFDFEQDPVGRWERFRTRLRMMIDPDRQIFSVDCSMALWGGSFRLEMVIPEELRIAIATFTITDGDGELHGVGAQEKNVNRASLYAANGVADRMPFDAYLELIPERAGHVTQALGLGVLVTATLAGGSFFGLDVGAAESAVSILLAGAAFFSGLSASSGDHVLVRQVFSGSRRATVVVALAAMLGSLTLVIDFPSRMEVSMWGGGAAVALLATIKISISWMAAASNTIGSAKGVEET